MSAIQLTLHVREKLSHAVASMLRPLHLPLGVHAIQVVATFLSNEKVAIFPQVTKNANHGSFGEIKLGSDSANGGVRMLQQVKEDRRVIGEYGPVPGLVVDSSFAHYHHFSCNQARIYLYHNTGITLL